MNTHKKSKIGFSILAFARPEGLLMCVQSIERYAPGIPIVISIDTFLGDDEYLTLKNLETIEVATKLLKEGKIVGLFVSSSNLKTKRAWVWSMENSFTYFEHSIYFEDDLRLLSRPNDYLESYLSPMAKGDRNFIATLYSSRVHTKGNWTSGFSVWPELWGVIMSEEIFTQFQNFSDASHSEDSIKVSIVRWGEKNLTPFGKVFKAKILRFWSWKFQKALLSDTAWDTSLHYFIWNQDIPVMIPRTELVKDTGVDFTSVSKAKVIKEVKNCNYPLGLSSSEQKKCLGCKIKKEFSTISA